MRRARAPAARPPQRNPDYARRPSARLWLPPGPPRSEPSLVAPAQQPAMAGNCRGEALFEELPELLPVADAPIQRGAARQLLEQRLTVWRLSLGDEQPGGHLRTGDGAQALGCGKRAYGVRVLLAVAEHHHNRRKWQL